MKSRLLLIFAFCISLFTLSAQFYELSVDSVEYVPLENSISLTNGEEWDDDEYSIPLDFDVSLFGNIIPNLIVDSNGAISDEGFNYYDDNLTALFPFFSDLVDRGELSQDISDISYLIEGEEGDRILKVEWSNVGFFDDFYAYYGNSFANIQLWYYERDASIEYRYGDSFIENSYIFYFYGGGPLVGMLDNFDTEFDTYDEFAVLAGDPSEPSVILWKGEIDFEYIDLLNGAPVPNTRYRFSRMDDVSTNEIPVRSNQYSVYPNPATSVLSLEKNAEAGEVQSVAIYSNDGRLMKTIVTDYTNINVADLGNGVYHLNIVTKDGLVVKRFVKLDK